MFNFLFLDGLGGDAFFSLVLKDSSLGHLQRNERKIEMKERN